MKTPESERPASMKGELPNWLIWTFAVYHLILMAIFLLVIYKISH